ncbi:tRNA (guanine(10)-N(2))-dimethyltransferase [Candidatus Bathyarchaeota archaeon]|nr:tRNA (guanine(10)-N(2))-dimethyltransferase [Candidatus Bathyarchaeota archaeon]MBS7630124.1 tRNA (guanine(10)-N(2))-dimethyltransferase [Candidatus Bathyarchaeota archaeon]
MHQNQIEFPTRLVYEGSAKIKVPELEVKNNEPLDYAISKAPVFYNPIMRLNRDFCILALKAYQKNFSKPITICEPMCGTGVRGIRIALEVPEVSRVILSDINPKAVQLAFENARLNNVSEKVRIRWMEASLLLSLHCHPNSRFDYIDIDPYGSPVKYMDSALRAINYGGMIALTATDMAPLCGVNSRACLRKYGSLPIRASYCHELAVRILIGALVRTAARFDLAATPVFSYAINHYIRLYAILRKGIKRADTMLKQVSFIRHCLKCLDRKTLDLNEIVSKVECKKCGSETLLSGPLWIGELADRGFVEEMLANSEKIGLWDFRLSKTLHLLLEEIGQPPTFFNIDELCSRVGVKSVSTDLVVESLREKGFKASKTHFDERGVKTNADVSELYETVKTLSRR